MHHHRWFPAAVLAAVCVLLSTAPGSARLLQVKQDGTKEYSVLQDALSAAATGDTILIHPGNYQNWTERYHGGAFRRAVGFIESGVTIMAETWAAKIIPPDVVGSVGLYSVTADSVAISGLRVMGNSKAEGVFAGDIGHTRVSGCLIESTKTGVVCGGPTGSRTWVTETSFVNTGGVWCAVDGWVRVWNCDLTTEPGLATTALIATTHATAEMYECSVTNSRVAHANTGGHVIIRDVDCTAGRGGLNVRDPGSKMELTSVSLRGAYEGGPGSIGIEVKNEGEFYGSKLRVERFLRGVQLQSAGTVALSHSHVVGWSEWAVMVTSSRQPPMRDWDLTGNWWGTADSTAISDAIWDGHDDPISSPFGFIEFWPAATQRVSVQQRSVGRMKGFYKHEE